MEDLRNIGEDLIVVLEELDCKDTPKSKEIRNTIDSVTGRYDQIQEDVVDKQVFLRYCSTLSPTWQTDLSLWRLHAYIIAHLADRFVPMAVTCLHSQ